MSGWIGVDLDGTLAQDEPGKPFHPYSIGEPVPLMLEFVKQLVTEGKKVKIFTARMAVKDPLEQKRRATIIQDWCETHGLPRLEVTNIKDTGMRALYDDRAFHVIRNTGKIITP